MVATGLMNVHAEVPIKTDAAIATAANLRFSNFSPTDEANPLSLPLESGRIRGKIVVSEGNSST